MNDDRSIEVIVEIPRGSRNKYEYDHERHLIRLDRRLFSATFYPADYGFVPETLAEDGDPLDALVMIDEPTFPGCLVDARPVGVFWMSDEKGPDAKVITVACGDPMWNSVFDVEDLPPHLTHEIAHFFEVYKDLEPGKGTEIGGFEGVDTAWKEIERSTARGARPRPDRGSASIRAFSLSNSSWVSAPESRSSANCLRWLMRSVAAELAAAGAEEVGADSGLGLVLLALCLLGLVLLGHRPVRARLGSHVGDPANGSGTEERPSAHERHGGYASSPSRSRPGQRRSRRQRPRPGCSRRSGSRQLERRGSLRR